MIDSCSAVLRTCSVEVVRLYEFHVVIIVAEYEASCIEDCRLSIPTYACCKCIVSGPSQKSPLNPVRSCCVVECLSVPDNLHIQMSKRERQDTPDWQQEVPYKLCAQNDKDFQIKYKSSCLCGAVEYAVDSDPCAAKFCHCTGCQRLHGTSKSADVSSELSRQAGCL